MVTNHMTLKSIKSDVDQIECQSNQVDIKSNIIHIRCQSNLMSIKSDVVTRLSIKRHPGRRQLSHDMATRRSGAPIGHLVSHDVLLGRWRLTLDMFGRIFADDVGSEPGSVIGELGGFPVRESRFRSEMERLHNQQQRDLTIEVSGERERGRERGRGASSDIDHQVSARRWSVWFSR